MFLKSILEFVYGKNKNNEQINRGSYDYPFCGPKVDVDVGARLFPTGL